jgi:glyoxylase-like metal-dependent hydrolase (beta-lactamase superfamily II)
VPHGSVLVGGVEVIALCDAVVLSGGSSQDKFPGASSATWNEARDRYAEVFGERGAWRLHVHCFVLRSRGRTVLVDSGIGPDSAPAFAWTATRGRLPEELEAAGISPEEVDHVLVTHVHDDHLGWNVTEGAAIPLFANARYVVHEADWSMMANATDEEDREIFAAVLQPLARASVLIRSRERLSITDELTLVHAPGHTPGHQVVVIDSGVARALISGDLVNHPVQLLQPGVNAATDMEPALAAATRAAWLERLDGEPRLICPAHLPDAFGRFVAEGDRWSWVPEAAA